MAARHHVCRDVHRIRPEHHAGVSPAVLPFVVQGEVAGAVVHPHLRRHGDGELRARVVLGPPPPSQAHRRRYRSVQHPTWLPPRAHRLGGVPPNRWRCAADQCQRSQGRPAGSVAAQVVGGDRDRGRLWSPGAYRLASRGRHRRGGRIADQRRGPTGHGSSHDLFHQQPLPHTRRATVLEPLLREGQLVHVAVHLRRGLPQLSPRVSARLPQRREAVAVRPHKVEHPRAGEAWARLESSPCPERDHRLD